MYWKPANYIKAEGEAFSPCYHNTVNIPDHMVTTTVADVPTVTMTYNYKTRLDKDEAEVYEIIKTMNLLGKFVSKAWICRVLNFKDRKADDIFTSLKKQGKIEEFLAVRAATKRGNFYRVAGHIWKRRMQRVHASLRRALRAEHKRVFPRLSQKGSQTRDTFSNQPSQTDINNNQVTTTDDSAFGAVVRKVIRSKSKKYNYPDGSEGDGRNGTCYSTVGCHLRLTGEPDTNPVEYKMVEDLLSISGDFVFEPVMARSLARRIDSGLINPQSVARLLNIVKGKNWVMPMRSLILQFETLLIENTEKIVPAELSYLADRINFIVDGSSNETVIKTCLKSKRNLAYLVSKTTPLSSKTPEKLIAAFTVNQLPVYANLFAIHQYGIPDDVISAIVSEFKDKLFTELSSDPKIVSLMREVIKFKFIDWNEFMSFRINFVGDLCAKLNINKFTNRKLDTFFVGLTQEDNATRAQQFAGTPA